MRKPTPTPLEAVQRTALVLSGAATDYDPLLDLVGGASFVLLGEGSHGTQDFYEHRAEITRRLIEEKGFSAVAVEADWPDAYRVNRYVRGDSPDKSADAALGGFKSFPAWMWRNTVVRDFVDYMRARNAALPPGRPMVGFYGVDLYSLYTSVEAVVGYLDGVDPQAAKRARDRYACLTNYGRDEQAYGFAASLGLTRECEEEVVRQLLDLRERSAQALPAGDGPASDERFFAEQNARLVVDAERYYRSMFGDGVTSWNLRDQHMVGTIEALADHLRRTRGIAKIVVWEHNSHLGDARATQMGAAGEQNVGQLMRQNHPGDVVNVGFTTYGGTVTAASEWGGIAERKQVRPALPDSWEALFHRSNVARFLLPLRPNPFAEAFRGRRLERAIGVIYQPLTERQSHYFYASLADQFDAVIHVDESNALEPLELTSEWREGEPPETYPMAV